MIRIFNFPYLFTFTYYLPRHEVGVAGNILIAGTVDGICTVHGIVPVNGIYLSVCKF